MDYYATLGIARDRGDIAVGSAYRARVKKYQPGVYKAAKARSIPVEETFDLIITYQNNVKHRCTYITHVDEIGAQQYG